MATIKVDIDRLEDLAAELTALHYEFGSQESRFEGMEEAIGHHGISNRLHELATNWTDARAELLTRMEALADLATDAARFYVAREQQLSRGFGGPGTGGS